MGPLSAAKAGIRPKITRSIRARVPSLRELSQDLNKLLLDDPGGSIRIPVRGKSGLSVGANKTYQQKGERGRILGESDEFRRLRHARGENSG
jgi:hypothetical protein